MSKDHATARNKLIWVACTEAVVHAGAAAKGHVWFYCPTSARFYDDALALLLPVATGQLDLVAWAQKRSCPSLVNLAG